MRVFNMFSQINYGHYLIAKKLVPKEHMMSTASSWFTTSSIIYVVAIYIFITILIDSIVVEKFLMQGPFKFVFCFLVVIIIGRTSFLNLDNTINKKNRIKEENNGCYILMAISYVLFGFILLVSVFFSL